MKVTVKVGLLFAALWIFIKMIFFWSGIVGTNIVPAVLLNMLCILLAISIGLYLHKVKQTEYTNALGDIKTGMTVGVPYAVVVSAFLYFYYAKIDPDFNAHQIADREYAMLKELNAPGGLQRIRSQNPALELLSKEEIMTQVRDTNKGLFNATSTMTLTMLALLLLATLNSIFVTVIMRRVIFRNIKYPYIEDTPLDKTEDTVLNK